MRASHTRCPECYRPLLLAEVTAEGALLVHRLSGDCPAAEPPKFRRERSKPDKGLDRYLDDYGEV